MKLKGKVALVTGGNSGFGQAMVLAFLKEGAKVAFCGRSEKKNADTIAKIKALSFTDADILCTQTDVSDSSSVKNMFEQLIHKFGTLDVLVNNAAWIPIGEKSDRNRKNFLEMTTTPIPKRSLEVTKNLSDEEWAKVMSVDMNGVFYCTREALKIMEEKKSGHIINIASTAALGNGSFHSPHYCAAKAGVLGFTRSVAAEVAGANVKVNAIAPGAIATEEFTALLQQYGPEITARQMQLIPAGRFGILEEYTSAAVFLASDDSNYMFGQVLSPNGGAYMSQ